jgi:hypothetical protein
MLQKIVEDAILMPHGVALLPCPDESRNPLNKEESMPCALSIKTQPDSSGLDPAMTERGVNDGLRLTPY